MAVALVALDAVVQLRGKEGARSVPLRAFHTEPGDRPDVETVMRPGELITHVDVPALPLARRSVYVKVRDRASFDFALASAAVALDVQDDTIRQARVALGGVGTKPWRASGAEDALVGKRAGAAAFAAAAEAALAGARPQKHNGFKIELAKRTVVRALERASGTA
jgi:xanthine dehydrogenase YagS FAD-binding subunit